MTSQSLSGTRLTIHGDVTIDAGSIDIPTAPPVVIPGGTVDPCNVKTYGAKGDGSTDDTAAIRAANAALASAGGSIWFPAGTYRITDTVALDSGRVGLRMDTGAVIRYTGPADRPAVVIGSTAAATEHVTINDLAVVCGTAHPYSNEAFVGVRVIRTFRSRIDVRRIQGFTVNLQLWGSHTDGIGYNTFTIGSLLHARVHLDINSRIPLGWINENLFIAGRYGNASDFPSTVPSYGVRFRAEPGAYTANNSNVFLKPCFELIDSASGVDRIPVLIDNAGLYNVFEHARVESGRGPVLLARGANTAYGNRVSVLFFGGGASTLEAVETGAGAYGNEVYAASSVMPNPRATWHSGDLLAKATATGSNISVRGCFVASSWSPAISSAGPGTILPDCISLDSTQAVGVVVDTSQYKTLIVQTNTLRGRTGRIGVVCLDAAGTILTASSPGAPHAQGTGLSGFGAYGYVYRVGLDGVNRAVIRVGASVASVRVVIAGGTKPADLVAFSVTGVGSGLDLHAFSVRSGTVPPT